MKNILFIFIIVLSGCSGNKPGSTSVTIDLNKGLVSSIPYSLFADSVSYVSLEMKDHFISAAERLYIEDELIFLEAGRKGGIFVFSKSDGSLLSHLDYFGQGPGEFRDIRAFTLDTEKKHIVIFSYPFLHKYTYEGKFVETIHTTEVNFIDFYHLQTGDYICIAPEDTGIGPNGVWLADSTLQYIRSLKTIPEDQFLFVRSTFYNRSTNGIYYYDRVWDDFSYITRDSAELLYRFDFKQRVPEKDRTKEMSDHLDPYSFISTFAHAGPYILLNYFNFNGSPSYWVLLNKNTNQTLISHNLLNDLSENQLTPANLFYIDNQTWCRIDAGKENNPHIELEFIHLKKE